MLIIEIPKSDKELIIAVKNTFENCEEIEVDSLSTDTIVQILVPMITVGIPAVSAIIVQILKNRKATVKYDRIEISGTPKNITKMLEQIKIYEASKKTKDSSLQKYEMDTNEEQQGETSES